MVIVDSSVWIDYFRGLENSHTLWLDSQFERHRLGLTDLNLCEVLQGIRDERQCAITRAELLQFEGLTTGGVVVAVHAAGKFRRVRNKRLTTPNLGGCLIATFC